MPELRIGISGWTYPPWRGVFFPKGLTQKRELAFASRQVNAIEINGSFYSLQTPASYAKWYAQTPDGFLFSVKCPRFITHLKRLRDIETPLANFFASGVLRLNEKLGPLLWQFPPSFKFDEARFTEFFKLLPRDTRAGAKLARKHDDHLKGRAWTRVDRNQPLQHVVEIRHATFVSPAFIALLRKHDIGLVIADTAGKWPFLEDITADLIYVRLHGDEKLYVSGYTDKALTEWARKIRGWYSGKNPSGTKRVSSPAKAVKAGRSVYVFFDNDVKVRAPFDAMTLAHKLKLGPAPEDAPPAESIAEEPRSSWPSKWGKRPEALQKRVQR
jgi:uncharacterized protein YecE (DUF72 family)